MRENSRKELLDIRVRHPACESSNSNSLDPPQPEELSVEPAENSSEAVSQAALPAEAAEAPRAVSPASTRPQQSVLNIFDDEDEEAAVAPTVSITEPTPKPRRVIYIAGQILPTSPAKVKGVTYEPFYRKSFGEFNEEAVQETVYGAVAASTKLPAMINKQGTTYRMLPRDGGGKKRVPVPHAGKRTYLKTAVCNVCLCSDAV